MNLIILFKSESCVKYEKYYFIKFWKNKGFSLKKKFILRDLKDLRRF